MDEGNETELVVSSTNYTSTNNNNNNNNSNDISSNVDEVVSPPTTLEIEQDIAINQHNDGHENEHDDTIKNISKSSTNQHQEGKEEEDGIVQNDEKNNHLPEKDNDYNNRSHNQSSYVGRKPKWWKRLAHRKGTKAQRSAINIMTEKGYVLPRLNKYLHVIDVQTLIGILPRGSPLTNDLLISRTDSVTDDGDDDDNGNGVVNATIGHVHSSVVTESVTKGGEGDETEVDERKEDQIIHLEIGFGQGENLLTNAMMNPNEFYIGAEIHQPGVGKALSRMMKGMETNTYWKEQDWWGETDHQLNDNTTYTSTSIDDGDIENNQPSSTSSSSGSSRSDNSPKESTAATATAILPYDNLRIYPGDGVKILRFLPSSSIDNIYLTFPDPWPKKDHFQFRVIQEDTLNLIRDVLKPGGHFYLATDAVVFDEWTRKVFDIVQEKSMEVEGARKWEELDVCTDRKRWLPAMSKYETKGIDEGRHTICTCWRKLI